MLHTLYISTIHASPLSGVSFDENIYKNAFLIKTTRHPLHRLGLSHERQNKTDKNPATCILKKIGVELLLCDIVLTLRMHKIHNVADRAASSWTYKNEAFL